jgi:hypothetical protein
MTAITKLWRLVLTAKVLLWLVVITALFSDFNLAQFRDAYAQWPPGENANLYSRFSTWDSAHYLDISERGYRRGSASCAFYPLWPAVVRVGAFFTGGRPLLASLMLTNALSLFAFWLFYRLVAIEYGTLIGKHALILMLAFPSALFFSFPYTESLYLAFVLVFFWELDNERYFWPCVIGFLMPLTKAIGVFVALPLAWHLYERRKNWRYWLLLLAPVLGWAAYFGLMYAQTGNAFEGFEAQKAYPYSPSIMNMFKLPAFFSAFASVGSLHGMMDSALDRGFFLLFLALLPLVYRLNRTWFWYVLPAGLVPALTSYFMSYRRYIMVLFPLFIVLAQSLAKARHRWVFWYYVAALAALQAWAVREFVNFNWAG